MSNTQAELVKKITLKGLNVVPKKHSLEDGERRECATVIGRLDSLEQKNTTYGDYVEFKGVFEAYVNGVLSQSANVILLPQVAESFLVGLFNNDGVSAIEFALKIGVKQDEKSAATGYSYTVEPLIETQSQSPLRHLQSLVGSKVNEVEPSDTVVDEVAETKTKK